MTTRFKYMFVILIVHTTEAGLINSFTPSVRFSGCVLEKITPIGMEMCVKECVKRVSCASLNFHRGRLECELSHSDATANPESLTSDFEYIYISRDQIPQQYFDTCGASCSTNRCCVSTATGPKCVKSDCPFNHPDANDTTVKVTSTKIGTTLFYTCNCNQSITLTSTCNADGAWTSSASYCNPRFEVTGADCADILKKDICTKNQDGVYTINPNNSSPKKVFCDMTTSGGGWTVIQNRIDGSIEFYRTWNDYKEGFGNSSKNHWIGNDMIHILTRNKTQKLRIELQRFSGEKGYAEYSTFTVFDETNKYMLNVSGFSGNIGDSLNNHNSMKFSTWDQDNDRHSRNCAQYHHGAWWYNTCYHSNLNGKYMNSSISSDDKSNNWGLWGISYEPMKTTRMMIRPGNL